jgi:hypothetical protein
VAAGIQHVDRIVGDTLNKQSELFLAFAQFDFRGPPLGQVAGDLGEADEVSLRGADGVDDNMGPKLRAVLTNTPTLALESPRALSFGQRQSGYVLGAFDLGVKGREMLADDLIRLITFEAASTRVPTGDATVTIQHVDRVVSDSLDEEPVAAIAGLGIVEAGRDLHANPIPAPKGARSTQTPVLPSGSNNAGGLRPRNAQSTELSEYAPEERARAELASSRQPLDSRRDPRQARPGLTEGHVSALSTRQSIERTRASVI